MEIILLSAFDRPGRLRVSGTLSVTFATAQALIKVDKPLRISSPTGVADERECHEFPSQQCRGIACRRVCVQCGMCHAPGGARRQGGGDFGRHLESIIIGSDVQRRRSYAQLHRSANNFYYRAHGWRRLIRRASDYHGAHSTTSGRDAEGTEVTHIAVDAVTLAWTDAMCTDMLEMMDALVDDPTADENSPVAGYREAQRAYFEAISNVVSVILADVSQRQPPAIPDGEALHQAYLGYVGDYLAVTSEGAMNIDVAANTREAIIEAVNKVHQELEILTAHDFGPDITDDPMMNAAMDLAPTCQVFD